MHQINVPSSAIFSTKFQRSLKARSHSRISSFVIGGDFSVIFDGSGGIKKTKESVKILAGIFVWSRI